MLTKKTPPTIKATLTIKAQGVENSLNLTYKNKSQEEYKAWLANPENLKVPDSITNDQEGITFLNSTLVLHLVESFDDGTDADFPLTVAGLKDLEAAWPGVLQGIVKGYHQARGAAVEKN